MRFCSQLSNRVLWFLTLAAAAMMGSGAASAGPEGPTGKVFQPIVLGETVDVLEQKALGLVTVNGGCSGTLLNRYWVLTADHCVSTDGTIGGPSQPLGSLPVTATWHTGAIYPQSTVRYGASNGLDVALIYLGRVNFGETSRRLIYHTQVEPGMTFKKFGQGICEFASGSGADAVPARFDCGYRSAYFTTEAASETFIRMPLNSAGQVGNGGDSGGPDYVVGENGAVVAIAGVQSTCVRSGLVPGRPAQWMWTTGISSCSSASLISLRDEIHRHMNDVPEELDVISAHTGAGDRVTPDTIINEHSITPDIIAPRVGKNCKTGFVWREARPEDLVCVSPEARIRTAQENADAANRVDPNGAYGPNTCKADYVWREAYPGDLVCVTPDVRATVRTENSVAFTRRAAT